MNFRQLRSLCEVVDRGMKVSMAANVLNQSQPSVTRQIQELEEELGLDIFIRSRNRILGLTARGNDIVALARKIMDDAGAMKKIAGDVLDAGKGEFTVAATHTQARYVLPAVIAQFMKRYPEVNLSLRQAEVAQCYELLAAGEADIAIAMNPSELPAGVICIPCYMLDRCIITPPRHPLLRVKPITLEAIARYPIIAYAGGTVVSETFNAHGLRPKIALNAVDADVSKAYVEMGLGIAILGAAAFDQKKDVNLRSIDAKHLFKSGHINVAVREQRYLRRYMLEFISMFAPHIRSVDIEHALAGNAPSVSRELPSSPHRR